jgi:hypothetical protein
VGIGTANPLNKTDIAGNAVIGAAYAGNSTAPANGLLIEGKVGVGTSTPAASAAMEVSSADKGFLPPRMTMFQMLAIANPANGLIVFCTTDNTFYTFLLVSNTWKEILYGPGTLTPGTCGTITAYHNTVNGVAPVNKTVTYNTVIGIPGEPAKCWITRNLGASQQATAVGDNTEESAGWYWQFNRKQGYKHTGSTLTPSWTITTINENSDWQTSNDPCNIEIGGSWRIPTYTEWYNVDNTGDWSTWNGPFSSGLKLHAAGYQYSSNGSLHYRGTYGIYWCGTQTNMTDGWTLRFTSINSSMDIFYKASGFSIRCIREN